MEENNSILLKLIENKNFSEILGKFQGNAFFLSPSLKVLWSSGFFNNNDLNDILKTIPAADINSKNAFTKSFLKDNLEGTFRFMPINYKNSLIGFMAVFIPGRTTDSADRNELNEYKHDFNNILTVILNLISASEKEELLPESLQLAKEIIEDIASTNGTSSYSLKSQLQIICSAFKGSYKEKINLADDIKDDLWPISISSSAILRIMTNLLTNAVEAVSSGGTITVNAHNLPGDNQQVVISVKDNGTGIPEQIAANIFNEGFSTKNRGSGSGLGIVKKLVEKAGGTVLLNSSLTNGTEFILTFPSGGKEIKHLAIVEDEALLNDVLSSQFEDEFVVHSYLDGESLLTDMDLGKIDLLIIDKKLPGINGIDCISKLRAKNKKVKIILASGSDVNTLRKGKLPSFDRVISKPYNFEELSSAVNELLS